MGTGGGLIVIDFTEQGNSAGFRRDGWSGQEPDRVWAIGPRSRLVVPIQSSGRSIMLEAEISPGEPMPFQTGHIVRVSVNDTAIGAARIHARSMIRCEIGPALARQDGKLEIDFGFPGFHRPNSLGVSTDDRPLSCWFSFMRLYTTDMFKPGPWFPASHRDIPVLDLVPPFAVIGDAETEAPPATYTFGTSGSAAPFLRDGWDAAGGDIASTMGSHARLELPAPGAPGPYVLRIDLAAPEFPDPERTPELTVLLDRVVIGQFRPGGCATCVMPVPRELTEGCRGLPLTLVFPDAGTNGDPAADQGSPRLAVRRIGVIPLSAWEASIDADGQPPMGQDSRRCLMADAVAMTDQLAETSDADSTMMEPRSENLGGMDELAETAKRAETGAPEDPGSPGGHLARLADHFGATIHEAPPPKCNPIADQCKAAGFPPNRMAASPAMGADQTEESPRDVARWVRNLPLRAPRDMPEVFLLLARLQQGESLDSLLNRMDFTGVNPALLFQILVGRETSDHDFAAASIASGARATFRHALLSREFRERSLFAFLDAFPGLARDIFIHVPKCAGTDLIMNLGQRRGMMPLPYMLRFRDWISDDDFLGVLGGLAQGVPFHDRIFVYGHMSLGEFPAGFRIRPNDKVFSIIRDPLALMVSHANYAIGRLRQDPEGHDPDTAETLSMLGMPCLPHGLSDRELKDLVVRVLFDPKIVFTNNACRHLGPEGSLGFEDAMAYIAANDIEITTTRHYERWLRERWGIPRSERHNRSDTILTEHEARQLYSSALRDATFEDLKLFNLVTWAIERAGTPSVTGQQIMRLAAPRTPGALADKLTGSAQDENMTAATGVFVVQEDIFVGRYLQAPSMAIPGGQRAAEILSLDFGAADIGANYLGIGWATPEPEFTWTRGRESTLHLPPLNSVGACVVRILGWPFIVGDALPSQEVLISVNGVSVGSCVVSDVCVIEFEVPNSVLETGAPLAVTLTIPGATRPRTLKMSHDHRVLGFCLRTLTVLNYSSQQDDFSAAVASPQPLAEAS